MHNKMKLVLIASLACSVHTTRTAKRAYSVRPELQSLLALAKANKQAQASLQEQIRNNLYRITDIETQTAAGCSKATPFNFYTHTFDCQTYADYVQEQLLFPHPLKARVDLLDKREKDYALRLLYYQTLNAINDKALEEDLTRKDLAIRPLSFDPHNPLDLKHVLFFKLLTQHIHDFASKTVVRSCVETLSIELTKLSWLEEWRQP